MAVLSELQIDIASNFGNAFIAIGEVVFKNPLGDVLLNSGVAVSVSGEYLPDYAGVNVLNLRNSSIANRDFWAVQAPMAWINFVFPANFDIGTIEIYNRGDAAYGQSPKAITITAFDANYENIYTLSATRPSDAAGASTTHNLADAIFGPFTSRGVQSTYPRLAPAANSGAPTARANKITLGNYNTVYGGAYKKEGVVIEDSIPVQRKVYLLNNLNGQIAFTTWSDKYTGEYVFNNISKGPFILFAVDHNDKYDITGKSGVLGD